jgi:hypothetical protein
LFWKATNKVYEERSTEKRIGYRNILIKGLIGPKTSYDEMERHMKMLEQLDTSHIELLRWFYRPSDFKQYVDLEKASMTTFLSLFKKVIPDWDVDFLKDTLADMETWRLIEPFRNDLQTMYSKVSPGMLRSKLTSKGISFLSFIVEEKQSGANQ